MTVCVFVILTLKLDHLLGKRKTFSSGTPTVEYLVKWEGYSEQTWEPRANLLQGAEGAIELYENRQQSVQCQKAT